MAFVELLWTLKSHSLDQLEDLVKMFSWLHFIPLFDLHRLSILGLKLLVHHYWIDLNSEGHLPLQVLFNGKLVVHPHRIPMLATLACYEGIVSYPSEGLGLTTSSLL
jgi:hypothetical protein